MERTNTLNGAVAIELVASLAEANMTRVQLAEKTGLHPVTITRLLKNQRPIDLEVFGRFAEAIGFNPRDLIERAERRIKRNAD